MSLPLAVSSQQFARLCMACALAIATPALWAAAPPPHVTANYHALAVKFHARAAHYAALAAEQKQELARREAQPTALAMKFPAATDAARSRYDALVYEQQRAEAKAGEYEKLAANGANK